MNRIKVGETITKYQDALTKEECDFLYNFAKENTNNPVDDLNKVPWELGEKNNTLYYAMITDQKVRDIIKRYKDSMAAAITEDLGIEVYPHLTTLVFWKAGQQMPRHVDDGAGYPDREQQLGMRFITSVSYINDNFKGGHTFIRNDGINDRIWRTDAKLSFPNDVFKDYISVPEKGSTVVFLANDSNAHGVTKLETGDRVILSTWFTKDINFKENDEFFITPEQLKEMQQSQGSSGQDWNK